MCDRCGDKHNLRTDGGLCLCVHCLLLAVLDRVVTFTDAKTWSPVRAPEWTLYIHRHALAGIEFDPHYRWLSNADMRRFMQRGPRSSGPVCAECGTREDPEDGLSLVGANGLCVECNYNDDCLVAASANTYPHGQAL